MKVSGESVSKEDAIYGPLIFTRQKRQKDGTLKDVEIVFWAQPVWDYEEFHKLCPKPENTHGAFVAPKDGKPGGFQVDNKHPEYQDQLRVWGAKRTWYQVIKTLEPSFKPYGDLEWEKVDPQDHNTWRFVDDELIELLPTCEFTHLLGLIEEANALDPAKMAARAETFFARKAAKAAEVEAKEAIDSQSPEAEQLTESSA